MLIEELKKYKPAWVAPAVGFAPTLPAPGIKKLNFQELSDLNLMSPFNEGDLVCFKSVRPSEHGVNYNQFEVTDFVWDEDKLLYSQQTHGPLNVELRSHSGNMLRANSDSLTICLASKALDWGKSHGNSRAD